MTRVFYAGIEMQIIGTMGNEMSPVRDGPTYLVTKHRFTFSAIINPVACGWRIEGGERVSVKAGLKDNGVAELVYANFPGDQLSPPKLDTTSLASQPFTLRTGGQTNSTFPVITLEAIKHALSQSRQRFVVTTKDVFGNDYIQIISPAMRPDVPSVSGEVGLYPCDPLGGPHPTVIALKPMADKTFFVQMTIETALRTDLFSSRSSINALMSHRWLASHDVDQDGYTTRYIRGRAIFRKDRLDLLQTSPDDYRSWLLHPVPLKMQRGRLHVQVSEDGTTLLYSFVDRQVPVTIIYPGVTRIECFFRREQITPSIPGIIGDVGNAALRTAGGFSAAAQTTALNPALGPVAFMSSTVQGVGSFASILPRAIPQLRSSVFVRVWGNPEAKRTDLYKCALQVAKVKMGANNILTGQKTDAISEDSMGTFIEFTRSVINGFVGNVGVLVGSLPGMDLDDTNDIDGVTTVNPQQVNNAAFPNDAIPGTAQGARGTFVQGIAAAALYGSLVDPNQPSNPGNYVARTPTYSSIPSSQTPPTQKGIPVIP